MRQRHLGVVFLVEDDEDLRESMSAILEKAGYLLIPARNGREALVKMRGVFDPAVAVVDLQMPEMNGWDLIEAMRTAKDIARMPVIVCTASLRVPVNPDGLLLYKPVAGADLLRAVRESLKFTLRL